MTFEDCWGREWPMSVADLMTATDERVWDRISGYTMFSTHLGNQTWKVTNRLATRTAQTGIPSPVPRQDLRPLPDDYDAFTTLRLDSYTGFSSSGCVHRQRWEELPRRLQPTTIPTK
ncbi:hypothetical protein NXS19_002025 [Fusarium pseudograminearum]|nr:hypothetical protein NXS19_002025 [Fusarium pseudograminearum]